MTERDEVLRKTIPDLPEEGIEHEIEYDYINEPYEVSHKDIISYNGEGRIVNLGPQKLRELQDAGEDSKELRIALKYWAKNSPGGCEAGEPYRGEPATSNKISKLSECISGDKATHISAKPLSNSGSESEGGLIDFNMLED